MSGKGPRILIGDANGERSEFLRNLLDEKFWHGQIQTADNFSELERLSGSLPLPIIFLGDGLPLDSRTREHNPNSYVYRLKGSYDRLIWILGKNEDPKPTVADED